ncbi:MAG: NUDIX domain-containing protein [Candidatus Thermoplasmatota archaeon]|nr:NUDIX domain-containing protein [Candidatus Thermoplasmatota archaeon]
MAEPFVYVIAFIDDSFVMVRHRRRAWEMPGGRIEPDETPEAAAIREFLEETGMSLTIAGAIAVDGGTVFAGIADGKSTCNRPHEIIEVRTFEELPNDLSFPEVEYRKMVAIGHAVVESFKRMKGINGTASPQVKP